MSSPKLGSQLDDQRLDYTRSHRTLEHSTDVLYSNVFRNIDEEQWQLFIKITEHSWYNLQVQYFCETTFTHRHQDKMATILQTTFLNEFSYENYIFRCRVPILARFTDAYMRQSASVG